MHRLRTVAFTVYLIIATLILTILWLPMLIAGRGVIAGGKLWARTALFGLKVICGISHRIENPHHIPTGAAIVAANHHSMWETIAFFAIVPNPTMVFKKELLRVPLYGYWARRSRSIAVDREAGAKAIRALTKAARERLAEGSQIVVFPEGTRVPYGERGPMQPGIAAIYALGGAPCVPAAHDSGRFWHMPGGLTSLKTPGVITLRFERPIPAGLDRKAFVAELERGIDNAAADIRGRASTEGTAISRSAEGSALA